MVPRERDVTSVKMVKRKVFVPETKYEEKEV